ncbi:MAG: SDR family oxidoreductase [Armatimonadota bacterium]|nr:SDR family oxidoreductase [Armatimonadota bacterium]
MDYGFRNKIAVVVGGGGAIAGEIARRLGDEGAAVAVWDLSLDAAQSTAADIEKAGGRAAAVKCDAAARSSVESALDATLARFGTVDLLVNGAGGSTPTCTTSDKLEFFDIDAEAFDEMFAANYKAVVIPCQAVGRIFAHKQRGAIVNISSIAGGRPLTRVVGYSSAKAAVTNFTRWLAVHMALNYSPNIRVNALAPGFVLTNLNRFLLVDESTGEPTERGRAIISHVPMGRYGKPCEIAEAALFLLSERASFITGAVLTVDGGFSAFAGV